MTTAATPSPITAATMDAISDSRKTLAAMASSDDPRARSRATSPLRRSTSRRDSRMMTAAATPRTPATMTDIWASAARSCAGKSASAVAKSLCTLRLVPEPPSSSCGLAVTAAISVATRDSRAAVNLAGSRCSPILATKFSL